MYSLDEERPCSCLMQAWDVATDLVLRSDFLQPNRIKPQDPAKKDDDLHTRWDASFARIPPMLVNRKGHQQGTYLDGAAMHERQSHNGQSLGQEGTVSLGDQALDTGIPESPLSHVPLFHATSCPANDGMPSEDKLGADHQLRMSARRNVETHPGNTFATVRAAADAQRNLIGDPLSRQPVILATLMTPGVSPRPCPSPSYLANLQPSTPASDSFSDLLPSVSRAHTGSPTHLLSSYPPDDNPAPELSASPGNVQRSLTFPQMTIPTHPPFHPGPQNRAPPQDGDPPQRQGSLSPNATYIPAMQPFQSFQHDTPRSSSSTFMTPRTVREIPFTDLQLDQVIGEGGFGKVWKATWRDSVVAVKVMSTAVYQSMDVIAEFRREMDTMSCLDPHPHVLQLVGACTVGPNLALVAEYCSRGSLYAILHSPTVHLSWSQIIYLCLGVAKGMSHLHAKKILHRDLKSGNLLVDENLCVKIADFGLSKVMQDHIQTMTGGLGTYQWMAPEVLANLRYSDKADVYSFGIVLWECAARQVPYAGMTGMPAAIAVMNRGLRPDVPNYTPKALADLMCQCWAAVPQERPTFKELDARLTTMYDEMLKRQA